MSTPLDQVKTIVVVMLENRSFDHVLGFLSHEDFDNRADIEGLHRPSDNFDWRNAEVNGTLHPPTLAETDVYLDYDLPHGRVEGERDAIQDQLADGEMTGFVRSYFAYQTVDRTPAPMVFRNPSQIPITAALARNYTVCDHWFASIPTDTWPNRLMSLCGYTLIDDTSVVKVSKLQLLPEQKTIFDWLTLKGRSYKIYVDATPLDELGPPAGLAIMPDQWGNLVKHAHTLDTLAQDWNSDAPAPDVIYCDPFFNDFATVIDMVGNCNHPPLPMAYGEAFLAKVYKALTSNPEKWKHTMLVVCYDEHGGFFDHVPPPAVTYHPPAGNRWLKPTESFTTLGVRVPGIVISPLVEHGSVFKKVIDHTSILRLMVDKFGAPEDLAHFPAARERVNDVHSLAEVLTRTTPRTDDIVVLPEPPAQPEQKVSEVVTVISEIFRAALDFYSAAKKKL